MADNLITYGTLISYLEAVASSAGANEFNYGVPSELNNKHDRDYPFISVYPENTAVMNNDIQQEIFQARTTFRVWVWYGPQNSGSDNEQGDTTRNLHSISQHMAFSFLTELNQTMESNNNKFFYDNNNVNLQFFEEQGTDLIIGVTFTLTISYYEDCK